MMDNRLTVIPILPSRLRHVVDGLVRRVVRELRQGVGVGFGHPAFPGAAADGGDELGGLDVEAPVRVGHLGPNPVGISMGVSWG